MGWVWDMMVWLWPASLLVLIPVGIICAALYHWVFEPRWERGTALETWHDVRDPEKKPIDPVRPRPPRPAPQPKPKVWGIDDVDTGSEHNQDRWSS